MGNFSQSKTPYYQWATKSWDKEGKLTRLAHVYWPKQVRKNFRSLGTSGSQRECRFPPSSRVRSFLNPHSIYSENAILYYLLFILINFEVYISVKILWNNISVVAFIRYNVQPIILLISEILSNYYSCFLYKFNWPEFWQLILYYCYYISSFS
jgi:hypothetical protein